MVKKVFLFSVILLIATFGWKSGYADTVPDNLFHLSPVKQKVAFQKLSLRLVQNYPVAALSVAKKFLKLPKVMATNQEKYDFFRILAVKFEQTQHYEQALLSYKIADSLAALKTQPEKNLSAKAPAIHTFSWSFYLFLVLLVVFLVLLAYGSFIYLKLNARLRATKTGQDNFEKELGLLQAELDEKVKTENFSLLQQFDEMKAKEVELKSALKKAEEASFLRNAFIANLGFDVRTPLSGIIGFANMLETELAVKENQELYEYAANIEKSGNRLLKLLNNVIDLSSLEANSLRLNIIPVNLQAVINNTCNQYIVLAREKNLIFKSKIDPELRPVLADEKNLEKVLMQIVDNAIQYTEKGFVTLSAVYDPDNDIDLMEIKDTGPGIDKKHQKLLFEIGAAGDDEQLKYDEGTGIGLKLAKKLMDLMKGGMILESEPGAGTTFRLSLPCSDKAVIEKTLIPERGKETGVEITTASELGNLDVFVVEDDRMNRIILEKMLKNLGNVKLAVDGEDCMKIVDSEAAKGHFYQIMLFDINLPGDWDGVILMKEIRNKYPEYRKIPFIAQTAYALYEDKERFLKEGFDSYLSKPIDRNELISTIKQQLRIFGHSKN